MPNHRMINEPNIIASEIFQRMDARDARQDQLNRVLSVISTAAIITAGLSFLVTIYVFFGV